MKIKKKIYCAALLILLFSQVARSQKNDLVMQAEQAMVSATNFMVNKVSTNGGYVWYYLPDLTRRWGEMEAYKTMVWVQDGGTVTVGQMLIDAYIVTKNEVFYHAAEKAAAALIWGQSHEGGWNYMIDFAGDKSLQNWYATIGKNGWRLEEFQHYYGNDTFDDDVTSNAARFLLRMYLLKLDPKYKPALDKAINFLLRSQYATGGWPQRFPLKYDFNKAGHPDYSSFYTFNDDVIYENVNFLIQCYETLGEERLLDPIKRGMNFYLLSQKENGAWGQQYTMEMKVAGARTYEPTAYLPRATFANCFILMKFYQYTGDTTFLKGIPAAITWLNKEKLPPNKTANGRYTHSLFVAVDTDAPVYVHRKGSNVKYGYYYTDTIDTNPLSHMQAKSNIDIQKLVVEFARIETLPVSEVTKNSPLIPSQYTGATTPGNDYNFNTSEWPETAVTAVKAKEIINALDKENRWLVKHVSISNPYIGDGQNQELTNKYASTNVGDETDTSPYRDPSEQDYISTPAFIRNMNLLITYIKSTQLKK